MQLLQKCLVESDESRIKACPKVSALFLTDGPSLSGDTNNRMSQPSDGGSNRERVRGQIYWEFKRLINGCAAWGCDPPRGWTAVVLDPPALPLSSAVSRFWLCGDACIIELLSTFFFLQPPAHQARSNKQHSSSAFILQVSVFSAVGPNQHVITGNKNDLVIPSGHFLLFCLYF